MKKRVLAALLCAAMTASLLVGCGGNSSNTGSEPASSEKDSVADTGSEADTSNTGKVELSIEPVVYYGFESKDEGWSVLVEDTTKGSNKAYDAALATGSVNRTIIAGDMSLVKGVDDGSHPGVVGNCIYLDRSYALDLEFEATNTDAWSVSFWTWALGMTDYMPTLQFGTDLAFADGQGNVSWLNVTKTAWVGDVYPMLWSRNEIANSWPWMYAYDTTLHGYKEWVHITIVATGDTYTAPDGIEAAGCQLYLDGQLVYDSYDNYNNATYFEVTDGLATLAPYLMKPEEGTTFESYFGINYWDTMFKGCVDEFYLFDKALTADDVAALYAMGDAEADPNVSTEGEPKENPKVLLGENSAGKNDYSSNFWEAFSQIWEVKEGETKTISFKGYHTNLNFGNYMNPVVILQNVADGHSTADNASYAEYLVARTDNYAWKGDVNTNVEGHGLCTLTSDWDWTTIKDDTHDATFEVAVTNNGTTADIVMTVTSATGVVHTQSYTGIAIDGPLYVTFTVDHGCIDEITVK